MLERSLMKALEQAYDAFRPYPSPRHLEGSPLKDTQAIDRALVQAPLRELTAAMLGPFSLSAIYTVGDTNDYRHFLPRILELSVGDDASWPGFGPKAIAEKLRHTAWHSWPGDERRSIEAVFQAAWADVLGDRDRDEPLAWLVGMSIAAMDVQEALARWEADPSISATLLLRDLVLSHQDTILRRGNVVDATVTRWLLRPTVATRLSDAANGDELGEDDAYLAELAAGIVRSGIGNAQA